MSSIKEFEHLKVPLEAIKLATNNFGASNFIGRGGFGKVYKGELIHSRGQFVVAVKRLDRALGQGTPEFWKEIMMLSRYRHENLVSLLGFCDEGGENILVYEYMCNKSLDMYLSSTHLSWIQRLNICIGAARGLEYLHNPGGTTHRVLHRDIKSSNILLDENWKARISDLGLSKFGPANQEFTFIVSNAVGTFGYCDPLYADAGFLTKESDVYSFGVVLFEVLCGRLCIGNYDDGRRFLSKWAQRCYEEKKLGTIVHGSLREQMSPHCLDKFSAIAYQCLRSDRKERPTIAEIVKQLETALQYQVEYNFEKEKKLKAHVVLDSESDEYWEAKLPRDWEVIIRRLNPHATYATKKELFTLLNKGILFDNRNRFFWIDNDGKKCEMISSTRIFEPGSKSYAWTFQRNLRFSMVAEFPNMENLNIRCQIRTSMLSLGIMYAAKLVFKYRGRPNEDFDSLKCITVKWKFEELIVSSTHFAEQAEDRWSKITLWHFCNHEMNADFEIVLKKVSYQPIEKPDILILGIEFQPVNMWFSLCELTCKKCHMLPANEILGSDFWNFDMISRRDSRFGKAAKIPAVALLRLACTLKSDMFSPHQAYACYLIFKFTDNQIGPYDCPFLKARYYTDDRKEVWKGCVYFSSFDPVNIPIITPKNGKRSRDSPKGSMDVEDVCLMKKRMDGWMEVMLCPCIINFDNKDLWVELYPEDKSFRRIIVQGIEFRPNRKDIWYM